MAALIRPASIALLPWLLPVIVFVVTFAAIRTMTASALRTVANVDSGLLGDRKIELGNVHADAQADTIVANFSLTWNGTDDITVKRITTSCGCATPLMNLPKRITPGNVLDLPVTIDWRGRTGKQESLITLELVSGDGTIANLGLRATGVATQAPISFYPREVKRQDRSLSLRVTSHGGWVIHGDPVIAGTARSLSVPVRANNPPNESVLQSLEIPSGLVATPGEVEIRFVNLADNDSIVWTQVLSITE